MEDGDDLLRCHDHLHFTLTFLRFPVHDLPDRVSSISNGVITIFAITLVTKKSSDIPLKYHKLEEQLVLVI
jgi:hypothetical protein